MKKDNLAMLDTVYISDTIKENEGMAASKAWENENYVLSEGTYGIMGYCTRVPIYSLSVYFAGVYIAHIVIAQDVCPKKVSWLKLAQFIFAKAVKKHPEIVFQMLEKTYGAAERVGSEQAKEDIRKALGLSH